MNASPVYYANLRKIASRKTDANCNYMAQGARLAAIASRNQPENREAFERTVIRMADAIIAERTREQAACTKLRGF